MSTRKTSAIFDVLPGMEAPVGRVAQSLEEIWADAPDGGATAPSEFRASQMNLVLHLGMHTTPESARAEFANALALSRRHPARTVILCPMQPDEGGSSMRAKIFSECFIGESRTEMVCCEVVMLSYPFDTRRHLENQVSVCLEADLPLYYWPHCIANSVRLQDYSYLLKGARRILVDSACESSEVIEALAGCAPRVRDFADARLLQVRQSLGRFISGFSPAVLVGGLTGVIVAHDAPRRAEAARLMAWIRRSLRLCGGASLPDSIFEVVAKRGDGNPALSLEMSFSGMSHGLRWEADFDTGHARMSASLRNGGASAEGPVSLLKPETALAEAIFS